MNGPLYRFELSRHRCFWTARVTDTTIGLTVLSVHDASAFMAMVKALILSPIRPRTLAWLKWFVMWRQTLFLARQRLARFLSPSQTQPHNNPCPSCPEKTGADRATAQKQFPLRDNDK